MKRDYIDKANAEILAERKQYFLEQYAKMNKIKCPVCQEYLVWEQINTFDPTNDRLCFSSNCPDPECSYGKYIPGVGKQSLEYCFLKPEFIFSLLTRGGNTSKFDALIGVCY